MYCPFIDMTAKAAAHAVVEPLMMYDIKMDGKTRFQKKKKRPNEMRSSGILMQMKVIDQLSRMSAERLAKRVQYNRLTVGSRTS